MEKKKVCTAIVLCAGQGKRMKSKIQKLYLELDGKPIIFYTLRAFEESAVIDNVVLVAAKGQEDYVKKEIVEKYGFQKVEMVISGGEERYDSVWAGLQAVQKGNLKIPNEDGYLFIHDGARIFVDETIITKGYQTVVEYGTAIAAVPSKDTVKLVDEDGFVADTPRRKYVWTVQTPQIFEKDLIIEAYRKLMQGSGIQATDDAMVVEEMMHSPVKLFEASYENIKITTPEDLEVAAAIYSRRRYRRT